MSRTRDFTRRRFIKAAASVVSVPFIIPRSVLGAKGFSPNNKFTLGFIGVGKRNTTHLHTFLRYGDVQILAVCDVDTNRRENARKTVLKKYGSNSKCDSYNDFRKILSRDDIDGVVIATPDHWHTFILAEACKAKKDIYCEKPLTLTIGEAKYSIDVVRKHNVIFQTGSQQRSAREFRHACELVRSGKIGKVLKVYADVGGPSRWCDLPGEKMEPGLDWDRWLGPSPKRPYNSILSPRGVYNFFPHWRDYREYSGGGMTDWGAHHFDIAQWGLGMDKSGPVKVIPPKNPKATKGVRWIYANGVELIHDSYKGRGGVNFVGTKGVVYVNRGKSKSEPGSILKEKIGENDVHLYKSPGQQRDWLNCVRSRKRPICDVEIGARSVTVCHLGNLAYWYHRKLRWDPKNWKFLGDDEANTWMTRKRRHPWELPKI